MLIFLLPFVFNYFSTVEFYPGTIIPLQPLHADMDCGHLGSPDEAVSSPHHFNGNLTHDVLTRPQVGLMPL